MLGYCVRSVALLFFALGFSFLTIADEQNVVDGLLAEGWEYNRSAPAKVSIPLAKLQALQSTFSQAQSDNYNQLYAHHLGYQGQHEERVAFVQSVIGRSTDPDVRASLLFALIDGNRALGRDELALQAMNESIQLLPKIKKETTKRQLLQGAVSLLYSFRAYDEALNFAERLTSLADSKYVCLGLADKVDILFSKGDAKAARSLVQEAIDACDASKTPTFTLLIKSYAAIDQIDSGNYSKGIEVSLPLVQEFAARGLGSNWLAALEEALARAYLNQGNLERADFYALRAYERAQSGKYLKWQEKTSETMAAIKRAQGQLAIALTYYDIHLAFKSKALDNQQQKNLAYQRVKFETQDKANQMMLLEQKNKNLSIEKELQEGKYQNLILLLTLGSVALAILGTWLVKTLKQKNVFRLSAQVDGLTQVSNRVHFATCAQQTFKDTENCVSLVLFDMDLFKKINDTHGHAAGDWVLKTVCDTAKAHLRKTDIFGRLGGEEFAMCLPKSNEDEAKALAERCRAAIAAIDTHSSGFDFTITASFGIATRRSKQTASYEETLVQADKALYLSKNEGRNRVTAYQNPSA